MMRKRFTALAVALIVALERPKRAGANGGQVQVADSAVGPYRVTVTTSPNPLRVGKADVSVLVLESVDTLVTDATVSIEAAALGQSGAPARYPATHAQATNQSYYAANVTFPTAGRWQVIIHVAGAKGGGQVQFGVDVTGSVLGMTPFELGCTSIPVLAILAILIGELKRWLERRRRLQGRASVE